MTETNKFNISLDRVITGLNRAVELDQEYSVDIKRFIDKLSESDSFATLFHKELRKQHLEDVKNKAFEDKVSNLEDVMITKDIFLKCTSREFTGEWKFIDNANGIEVPKLSTKIAKEICYDVNAAYAIAYTRMKKRKG